MVKLLDLRPDELAALAQAASTVDELERLQAALANAPLTVSGSKGQPRPNPLLDEVRRHREVLARLLARIEVPDDDAEAEQDRKASSNRQASALRRWQNYRLAQEQERSRGA
jgi:hypothetical protein